MQNKCVIKKEDNQIHVSHGARNIKTNTVSVLTKGLYVSTIINYTRIQYRKSMLIKKLILHSCSCDAQGQEGYVSFIISCTHILVYFTACSGSKMKINEVFTGMLRGSLTSKQVCHRMHRVSGTLCFLKKIKQAVENAILSVCMYQYIPTYQIFFCTTWYTK